MTQFFRFLLIGTFLLRLFPATAQKYYYAIYDKADNIPFRSVHSIMEGPKGYIWISQSDHSVARWQDGSLSQYSFSPQPPDTPHHIFIQEDASGRVWAGSQTGSMAAFHSDKDQFVEVLKTEPIRAFRVFGDTLWTGGQTVQLFNIRSDGRLQPILQKSIPGTISSIAQDRQGQFLLATEEGELFICPTARQDPAKVFGSNERQHLGKYGRRSSLFPQ